MLNEIKMHFNNPSNLLTYAQKILTFFESMVGDNNIEKETYIVRKNEG